jgi:hypothetical protein
LRACGGYYPEKWFANDKVDDEEKYLEVASTTDDEKRGSLPLGMWIFYDGDIGELASQSGVGEFSSLFCVFSRLTEAHCSP